MNNVRRPFDESTEDHTTHASSKRADDACVVWLVLLVECTELEPELEFYLLSTVLSCSDSRSVDVSTVKDTALICP